MKVTLIMSFCPSCGTKLEENSKFCPSCGTPVNSPPSGQSNASQIQIPQTKETVFYKGHGTLLIKRTKKKGAGAKAASWLAFGPIGYVAFGRDKKSKSKAEGELIVSNKAIYCAGNDYPFDRLLSLTRDGKKTVVITFENDVAPGGDTDKGALGLSGVSIEAEIIMKSREECDELFIGLQHAKTSHLDV